MSYPESKPRAGLPPYNRDALITVCIAHQRRSDSNCLCGWGVLGHSFAAHIADQYEQFVRDREGD